MWRLARLWRGRLRPRRRPFSRLISKIECIEIALFTREQRLERQSVIVRWTTHVRVCVKMNPNFFPNGYQDPKHPEDEVVSNWVRVNNLPSAE
jgi:hypothetical protein